MLTSNLIKLAGVRLQNRLMNHVSEGIKGDQAGSDASSTHHKVWRIYQELHHRLSDVDDHLITEVNDWFDPIPEIREG